MIRKRKIQGKCPCCDAEKVNFADHIHYINNQPSHIHNEIPTCAECGNDEIQIRKINNRRYKVIDKQ